MPKNEVPLYPLDDYASPTVLAGVHFCRFEENIRHMTNRIGLHRHGYFEVFWLEGRGAHVNDFHTYPIEGPSLIFVTPGQVHAWSDYLDLRGVMVAFTQEFFDGRCQPPSELLQFPFWYPEEASPVMPIPAGYESDFVALIREVEAEFEHKQEGYENVLRWLLRILFERARRIYQTHDKTVSKEFTVAVVRDFRLMLEERFRVVQKVSDYARHLGLSADRLSELTKEHTGYSAGELIRQRLLLESQRMLAHTELSMSEIAYQLNFQDPSYFSRFFRKQTGRSPGDFRGAIHQGLVC